jgi:uncharacterized protein with PIN domain
MQGQSRKPGGSGKTVNTVKKFFADSMLGKLALWMRVLGFDVAYERAIEDAELVKRALKERRTILTRDTLLVLRRWVRDNHLFIESDHLTDQLSQVLSVYGMDPASFLTRCLRCNIPLEEIGRDTVEKKVPAYVYKTQKRFLTCPGCARVYWAGTHRDEMLKEVARIRKGLA